MKVENSKNIVERVVEMPGASGCKVRWLVSQDDGAPTFAMRQFEVAPGGYTPKHSHPYEHEVYILEGEGLVLEGDEEHRLLAGDVVFVKPGEVHQFRNAGDRPMRFLCMVPNDSAKLPVTLAPECEARPVTS